MSTDAFGTKAKRAREEAAEAWLHNLQREIPYKDKDDAIIIPVMDVYAIIFHKVLTETFEYDKTLNNYLGENAIAFRLARFIDAVDPRLQGRPKSREEETAELFIQQFDLLCYAQIGLERGQTKAIEAGLSGIDLGSDFKGALNQLWREVHPFVVQESKGERGS